MTDTQRRRAISRTVIFVGGGLAVAAGVFLHFGLTDGFSLANSAQSPIMSETPIESYP